MRSGTSPYGNHGEAEGAESRDDFIHKLRVCFKELRESRRWLKLIQRAELIQKPELLAGLINESELVGFLRRVFKPRRTIEKGRANLSVERSALSVERSAKAHSPIRELDYALLQQCIHCGMCLPTCPTYDATKVERNSPRGRIALMRAIADERLEPTRIFGEEMYFCLGCLACETACPAGVKYSRLFEAAREEAEAAGVLRSPRRDAIRSLILRGLFTRPRLLRFAGRLLWLYRASGAQNGFGLQLNRLLPYRYGNSNE